MIEFGNLYRIFLHDNTTLEGLANKVTYFGFQIYEIEESGLTIVPWTSIKFIRDLTMPEEGNGGDDDDTFDDDPDGPSGMTIRIDNEPATLADFVALLRELTQK